MTLSITLERHGVPLSETQEARVRHHLAALGRRLEHRPEPNAVLAFTSRGGQREIVASLRVRLGPLGPTLNSTQASQTPDRAAHLAVQAIERQLERRVSRQRGEPSYGVPSRRRPGPAGAGGEAERMDTRPLPEGS